MESFHFLILHNEQKVILSALDVVGWAIKTGLVGYTVETRSKFGPVFDEL